jgi:hypothetical protein
MVDAKVSKPKPMAKEATSDVDDPLAEQWYLATAQDMYALTFRGNKDPAATKAKILATATERHAAAELTTQRGVLLRTAQLCVLHAQNSANVVLF